MSDTEGESLARAFGHWKRNRKGKERIDLDPKVHHERPIEVDPRTLYQAEIERDTRAVRLDMSFKDIIKVRDQAELIKSVMEEIIDITRKKDLDDVSARRWARRQAAATSRTLTRFHGRVPRGDYRAPKK